MHFLKSLVSQVFAPRMRAISAFVLGYLLTAVACAFITGNGEFLFYSAIVFAIIALVVFMDRRVEFSALVLWGLGVWGLLHMMGGLMPIPYAVTEPGGPNVLYNMRLVSWLPKYDQFVHAFGFGMATIAAYESLSAHFGKKLAPKPAILAAVILIGMGLGAMNELIEFITTLLMPETNVGGYTNTGWDLVSNLTGCLIAAVWLKQSYVIQIR